LSNETDEEGYMKCSWRSVWEVVVSGGINFTNQAEEHGGNVTVDKAKTTRNCKQRQLRSNLGNT
jgi:hypothetical protein